MAKLQVQFVVMPLALTISKHQLYKKTRHIILANNWHVLTCTCTMSQASVTVLEALYSSLIDFCSVSSILSSILNKKKTSNHKLISYAFILSSNQSI